MSLHVGDKLLRNLLEDLLSKVTTRNRIVISDELDNIADTPLALTISETSFIAIKLLHSSEVSITDAHDND